MGSLEHVLNCGCRQQLSDFLDTDNVELELPKCNAFVRRLIYQTTAQKFKNKITLQTKNRNKDRILVASKFKSKKEQQEIDQRLFEEEMSVLDDFIGFTKVLRIVVDSVRVCALVSVLFIFNNFREK